MFGVKDKSKLTGKIARNLGVILIISFILPIYLPNQDARSINDSMFSLSFINIEGLSEDIGFLVKIFMIIPLVAGIAVLYLSDRKESRAPVFLIFGILPILTLVFSNELSIVFQVVNQNNMNGMEGTLTFITSSAASVLMLSAAYSVYLNKNAKAAYLLGIIGGSLYFLSILAPVNGEIPLVAPFKMITEPDNNTGILTISGISGIAQLVIMVIIAIYSFRLRSIPEKDEVSLRIIKLWFWNIAINLIPVIFGAFYLSKLMQINGIMILGYFLLIMLKFATWFGALYLLTPLAVSDLITLKKLVGTESMPLDDEEFYSTVDRQLDELISKKEKGEISQQEYDQKKRKILGQ